MEGTKSVSRQYPRLHPYFNPLRQCFKEFRYLVREVQMTDVDGGNDFDKVIEDFRQVLVDTYDSLKSDDDN